MKIKNILPIIAMSSLLLSSCDDQIMEWYDDPTHGEVSTAELPLELTEAISRYEALNTYTDFKLGVGVGRKLYMDDETYRGLINENFDEVTVGYDMKHGAMVDSKGEIGFGDVDEFMAKTKEAGLSVFGHTLVWHANQNASYLNGLIAPRIIPGSLGKNILTNGNFNENLDGWAYWGNGDFSQATADEALEGAGAFKIINTHDVANEQWKTQAQTVFPALLEVGKTYVISLYVRSEATGSFRLSTTKEEKTEGSIHYLADEVTTSSWQNYTYEIVADGFESGLSIDIGGKAGTYFIDKVEVVDKDAPVEVVNMLANGDFEDGTINNWGGWGGTKAISTEGEGYDNAGYAMVLTRDAEGSLWDMQTNYELSNNLDIDKEYTVSFMAKASTDVDMRVQLQSSDYSSDAKTFSVGTSWSFYTGVIKTTKADRFKFVFDTGQKPATFYIDDVVLTDGSSGGSGPTIIEKTDEEKTQIIGAAMEDWISKMVGHYKNDVFAWDVVNEPIKDGNSGEVRDGNISDLPEDHFYWVKYLGKDYAVTAFNLARQYGNATDKLFINDYNLESNLEKCDGLINYVQYIESQGASVDGIGTQMHISIDSDKDKMAQMFQKLAATGKLIKISELDISLGTNSPTVAQQQTQAEMYQYVLDMYMQFIPEAQRYGVTAWGISDNEQEHQYWLPDESPNLWDVNYERKHAYKGFADGLAGKDVSADFTGELVY